MKTNKQALDFIKNISNCCLQMQSKTFPRNTVITTYIANRNQLCILTEGEADLIRYDFNGNKTIVEHFTKNDIFGEIFHPVNTNNELLVVARTKCIWIKTHEEVLVIEKIKEYLLKNRLAYDVKSWSMNAGLQIEPLIISDEKPAPDKQLASIERLIATIDQAQSNAESKTCVYILKDLHLMLENKMVIRAIRDLKEKPGNELKSYQTIIGKRRRR